MTDSVQKVGGEFLVNTQTTDFQWYPTITGLTNGRFVITWHTWDTVQDGSGYAVKAQLFNADGSKVGGEFLVNTQASGNQELPAIAGLANGGFVVTWQTSNTSQDGSGYAIKAQVFDAGGAKVGSEFLVNTEAASDQHTPTVAGLTNGGFVISWYTFDTAQDGSGWAVKAQVFDAAGSKVDGEFLVNTQAEDNQFQQTVSGLAGGGFAITWHTYDSTQDGSETAVKAQVFELVQVVGPNTDPVANNDTAVATEDVPAEYPTSAFLANDIDAEDDELSITAVSDPTNGTVSLSGSTITFTPAADFNGTAGFDYTVSDGNGGSDTAHVAVTVLPVNDPVTAPDTNMVVTDEDTPSAPVPTGAMDLESTMLNYSIPVSAQPGLGSVSFVGDAIVYTPDPDVYGTDHFDIIISDGGFAFLRQEVSVTINPVNDDPVAGDDAAATDQDVPVDISAADLLANDGDIEGDTLTVTGVSGAVNGSVGFAGSTVTFTPATDFFGVAGFDYAVSDGNGGTDSAHVTVTVAEFIGNHPPVVTPDAQELATIEDTPISFAVTAGDQDDDPLTITPGTPAQGMVTDNGDGSFTYTPDPGYSGTDMFTMAVSDGNGGTDEQTITVAVKDIAEDLDWRLLAGDGWAGAVGGTGQVVGSAGFQSVKVLDLPGTVSFDPSFNGGEDFVCLIGNAADWSIVRSGSTATLFDGDTCVVIPVGTNGMLLGFDDGNRTLAYDTTAGSMRIGDQLFASTLVQIAAPAQGFDVPLLEAADALARLYFAEGGSAAAGGHLSVVGTNGAEELTLLFGSAGLDASFNVGNDMLILDQPSGDFTAARSGSAVLLDSATTDVAVPVGSAGMDIAFTDNTATLAYDAMAGAVFIGSQMIDTTPMPLSFA